MGMGIPRSKGCRSRASLKDDRWHLLDGCLAQVFRNRAGIVLDWVGNCAFQGLGRAAYVLFLWKSVSTSRVVQNYLATDSNFRPRQVTRWGSERLVEEALSRGYLYMEAGCLWLAVLRHH